MTALFPEFAPAETLARVFPASPSSVHTYGNISPEKRHATTAAAETPARVSERPRVALPPRRRHRSRRNADEDQAMARERDALMGRIAEAIRAVVHQAAAGDVMPPGLAILQDPTPTRRRRRAGGVWVSESSTRGEDERDKLLRDAAAIEDCRYVKGSREAQCGAYHPLLNSCKRRVCPACERARSARMVGVMDAVLMCVPKRRRSFITLTLRNVAVLTEGYRRLDRAFDALRRQPIWRGGACRQRTRGGAPFHACGSAFCRRWRCVHNGPETRACVKCRHRADRNCPDFRHREVVGGVRSDEDTFNVEARTHHPHRHILADAPFIVQEELSDVWRAITCPDPIHRRRRWCPAECDAGSPIVDVRSVTEGRVREAIKYVSKVTDLIAGDDPTPLVEFIVATRARRMTQGFGSFFNLELDQPDDVEPTVTLTYETEAHDELGRPIAVSVKLPRFCRSCGRDTLLADGSCTYEKPIGGIRRTELRLHNGAHVWRPPGWRLRDPDHGDVAPSLRDPSSASSANDRHDVLAVPIAEREIGVATVVGANEAAQLDAVRRRSIAPGDAARARDEPIHRGDSRP